MPLTMVGVGESRPILRIGGSDKVRTHLENLGFVEGETVRVVSDDRAGEGCARGHQP